MRPEEVRWGVLGCASIARDAFVPAVHRRGAGQVRAVASRSGAKAQAFASELGIPLAFDSYQEMLDSGAVDAVYIALPNALHCPWTIAALRCGLGVLCEKPLAVSLAEGRGMAEAARQADRPLVEGFMYRYHPWVSVLRRLLAEERLGEVRTLHGVFSFRLEDETAIPASAPLGGGALRDVGCYPVDAFCQVLGNPPEAVMAMERRRGVDWVLGGLIRFPGGVLGLLECGIETFERHEFQVVGTRGMAVVNQPWVPGADPVRLEVHREGCPVETIPLSPVDTYALEAWDLASALATGHPPRFPLMDSLWTLSAMDALLESAATKTEIRVSHP